jgi:hypothetical protein
MATGNFGSHFRLAWPIFWPSGVFRSSDATAQIHANHCKSLARGDFGL